MLTRPLAKPRRAPEHAKLASMGAYVLILILALSTNFNVRLVGSLPLAEFLVVPLTPILIVLYSRSIFKRGMTVIFVLMGLWLLGQVLTDIYRGTKAVDWMRGDAAIIFFAMDLACLAALLERNDRRKVVFLTGIAIGSMLSVLLQPPEERDIWKFGYSYGTMMLVILISCYFFRRRRYMVTGVLFVGLVGANVVFNYRSPILFLLVLAVLVLPVIPERIGPMRLLPRGGSFARVAVLAAMALGAGTASAALIHWATSIGVAGEEAQAKNLVQEQSKQGILLGGRPEILVSSRAVMDSPILGHGSWAKDMKYVEMLNDIQVENGFQSELEDIESKSEDVIPAHSHIMGAWVWAGVLGAIFWGYIFWLVLKSTVAVSSMRPPLAPIYAWLIVWYIWAIPFSPFGGPDRIIEAGTIVIMVDLLGSGATRGKGPKWIRQAGWRRIPQNVRLSSAEKSWRPSSRPPRGLNARNL
jgi:hypothetical protein